MAEHSGRQWCDRFPTSNLVGDLVLPFRENVGFFLKSLRNAGASVTISSTYRPAERAYLMHWCCMIAQSGQDPDQVQHMPGVEIDWTWSGDRVKAKAAAVEMMAGYNIAFPAALVSRHTQRRAIDMSIHWAGAISVKDARDVGHTCIKQADLWPIGSSFGVKKLPTDPPHWSDDGH